MILSLLYALVPVAIGGALAALSGRERGWMGPLRTLALTAALTLVLAELLPAAAVSLGAMALVAFAVGLLVPVLAERIGDQLLTAVRFPGLELAFIGLLGHQLIDGLQIGAATELSADGLPVALTIAAHSAPLVASAVFGYSARLGTRSAFIRVWLLAAATAAGVVLGHFSGADWLTPVTPWIQAVMAGLLLHILSHDLSANPPQRIPERVLDLLAAGAGVALPVLLMAESDHHDHSLHGALEFPDALSGLALMSGPVLVVALGVLVLLARRTRPVVSALDAVFGVLGPWIVAGLVFSAWGMVWLPGGPEVFAALPRFDGPVSKVSVLLVIGLALRGMWQAGTRGWLQALFGGAHDHSTHNHDHHEHEHDHDHDHDHVDHPADEGRG
ncbi:MAG: hypothetical protein ACI8RZ_005261 [Myxococcota bacterium]|jgi:hypothetical protein